MGMQFLCVGTSLSSDDFRRDRATREYAGRIPPTQVPAKPHAKEEDLRGHEPTCGADHHGSDGATLIRSPNPQQEGKVLIWNLVGPNLIDPPDKSIPAETACQ